jgi:hypothetical protein
MAVVAKLSPRPRKQPTVIASKVPLSPPVDQATKYLPAIVRHHKTRPYRTFLTTDPYLLAQVVEAPDENI